MKKTMEKYRDLELEIELKIKKYQEKCKHENVIKVAKADTGNWCPVDDEYWYECRCPDCDKRWTEPQ
jgi:hypothetical protein